MFSRVETITPDIATQYLTHNINNRKIKQKAIARYAADMKAGKWQLSPQGISFYENGNLADGQNRLLAIIKAGTPIDLYVTYGVPNDANIQDRGVSRSSSDVLKMSGLDSVAAGNAGVGLVNFLFTLAGHPNITDQTRQEFIKAHESLICDAVNLTARGCGSKGICRKSGVMAAAFCALYCNMPAKELARFFEVANTGISESPSETAAAVMRNFLIQDYIGNSFSDRRESFRVATNAIKDFVTCTPRRKKYRADVSLPFWKYTKKNTVDALLTNYIEK